MGDWIRDSETQVTSDHSGSLFITVFICKGSWIFLRIEFVWDKKFTTGITLNRFIGWYIIQNQYS